MELFLVFFASMIDLVAGRLSKELLCNLFLRLAELVRLQCTDKHNLLLLSIDVVFDGGSFSVPRCRRQMVERILVVLVRLSAEELLAWLIVLLQEHRPLHLHWCIVEWQLAPWGCLSQLVAASMLLQRLLLLQLMLMVMRV